VLCEIINCTGVPGGSLFETWLFLAGKKSLVAPALQAVKGGVELSPLAASAIWDLQSELWYLMIYL
jgi:hypothetical protein